MLYPIATERRMLFDLNGIYEAWVFVNGKEV